MVAATGGSEAHATHAYARECRFSSHWRQAVNKRATCYLTAGTELFKGWFAAGFNNPRACHISAGQAG